MTKQQEQFLDLVILKQKNYADISKEMNVDLQTLRKWWNELEKERESLSSLRQLWRRKCDKETSDDFLESFSGFKNWFDTADRKCYYCKITESEIAELSSSEKLNTVRKRGKKLEIERLSPKMSYKNINNLVFCCYWCNNAKSDEFSAEEFKFIGQIIGTIWDSRLKAARQSHVN